MKGIFFQGAYCGPGGSDAELRSWVMSKVLWDPNVDTDKLVSEWMQGVYGKAWQPMRPSCPYDLRISPDMAIISRAGK